MLILSRKSGESFFIGENIEITVFEIQGDKIRIGIDAPADIPILRKEIKETKEENVRASETVAKEKLSDLNDFIIKSKNPSAKIF